VSSKVAPELQRAWKENHENMKTKVVMSPFVLVGEYSRQIAHELDMRRSLWLKAREEAEAKEGILEEKIQRFMSRSHAELLLDVANLDTHYAAALELLRYAEEELTRLGGFKRLHLMNSRERAYREEVVSRKNYCASLLSGLKKAIYRRNVATSKYHARRRRESVDLGSAKEYLFQLAGVVRLALKENSIDVLVNNRALLDGISNYWMSESAQFVAQHPALIWEDEDSQIHPDKEEIDAKDGDCSLPA
jgi:hypothetical protein